MRKHLPRTEIESPQDKFAVGGGKIDSAQSAVRFPLAFLCCRTWWKVLQRFLFVSILITSTRLCVPHPRRCSCASWF